MADTEPGVRTPADYQAAKDAQTAGVLADLAASKSPHAVAMETLSVDSPAGGYGGEQGLPR